ncbi:MAG: ATP-grasp domain-containing protein [Acidobacteria bacterium]|nr:ATP-grasp domain-containing protein [Acidobacteriota bacterium]
MNALVTDGDERPALAITRSLGRRGIDVIVGEARAASLASSSRYCREHVQYPSPYDEPEAFARFLCDLVQRRRIDVVLPVTDVTTHAVAAYRERLARHTSCAVPSLGAFELAADKGWLAAAAAASGISVPRTEIVADASALPGVLPRLTYPVVVKPARSRIRTAGGWIRASVAHVGDEQTLRRLFRDSPHLQRHPTLIQERVIGPGTGVFLLCDRGRVLTAFAHRRLREKPPSGGASVLSESIAVDPALRAQAERLLAPLGWHGVAMLEYKRDRDSGRAYLMEMNGRFWGSLQLAVDAGVDFPYLAWQLARARIGALPAVYRIGVRSRWLLGDLDHLFLRMFRDDPALPAGAPPRCRAALAFLVGGSGARNEVLRPDDVRPGLHEMGRYAAAVVQSLLARTRRSHGHFHD